MKKLVVIFLALVMVLSLGLVACEKPDNEGDGELEGEFAVDMNIGANQGEFPSFEKARGENEKQLRIFWREAEHDYSDNDIWLWFPNAAGQLYAFAECTYGGVVVVNVPKEIVEVGFIVRANATIHEGTTWTDATKVYDGDRYVILTDDVTEIYLTGTNPYQFTSTDGGTTLQLIREVNKMSIKTLNSIAYSVIPATTIKNIKDVEVTCDGKKVKISAISSLGTKSQSGTIVLEEDLDLSKVYEVTIKGFSTETAFPLEVFDTQAFVSKYTYDGNDLGAVVDATGTTMPRSPFTPAARAYGSTASCSPLQVVTEYVQYVP